MLVSPWLPVVGVVPVPRPESEQLTEGRMRPLEVGGGGGGGCIDKLFRPPSAPSCGFRSPERLLLAWPRLLLELLAPGVVIGQSVESSPSCWLMRLEAGGPVEA